VGEFVKEAMESNSIPLPILNRILPDGSLTLINYGLNDSNIQSFSQSMLKVIPDKLTKLFLVNNSISDMNLDHMISRLRQTEGLTVLVIVKNSVGPVTATKLGKGYIQSRAFRKIKKFVLKDPTPNKLSKHNVEHICKALCKSSYNLNVLNKLTLSKLGMNRKSVILLSEAAKNLPRLHHLDLSSNGID